jgi:predicted naringenin-chalcone synthase
MAWPPKIEEPLPRAAEASGVRRKLSAYSLDAAHESGGPKARGFEKTLGITIRDIGYLEGAILTGILMAPLSGVRIRPPYGVHCEVRVPVRGLGAKAGRVVEVRTAWELADAAPRLVTAYVRT